MSTSNDQRSMELDQISEVVLEAIDKTLEWTTPEAMAESERHAFVRNLSQSRREFRRLRRAATRPMCVAVFGPSQVGKSYLINSLSRRDGRSIAVRFGEQEFDFLLELNPVGQGSEATGLVSRFTTTQSQTPEGFPVEVRLHNLSDIIKIIINTYFLDFNFAVEASFLVPEADIRTELEAASKSRGGTATGGLNEDDVLEIKEYVEERFHGRPTEKLLRTMGYWDDFAAMASQLGTAEVESLVEIIWGRTPRLTELFRLTRDALQKVGFSEVAYCEIAALKPREKSIINIDSLDDLGKPQTDTVRVKLPQGRVCELGRAEVTAIISELVLTLAEKPADYFDHADLLDFPGYRPRFELQPNKMQDYLDRPDAFRELFRRGKVDYLFDSYRREQEVSALLLCLGEGNQDVHAIPPLVDRWVKETHGATPELRQGKEVALFVVKTKFDTYFPHSEGADIHSGETWKKAVGPENIEFLGRAGDWPMQWVPGTPFTNLFWVRNPAMKNHGLLKYDPESEVESGLRDSERVNSVKQAYLAEPAVQMHFTDPERAFDAALELNDGGVSYLAEKLTPICNSALKSAQVETRMMAAAEHLLGRLSEHHISDDREEQKKKRQAAANEAVSLVINYAEAGRFCHLIDMLQATPAVLRRSLGRDSSGQNDSGSPLPGGSAAGSRLSINSLIGRSDSESQDEIPMDRSQFGAKAAITTWLREALAQVDLPVPLVGQDPSPDILRNLVQEIAQAAHRVELENRIARRIRELTSDTFSDDEFLELQSTIASEEVNDFAWTLGYRDVALEERPRLGGPEGSPVFADRQISPEDIDFDSDSGSHVDTTVASWCVAYLDMVERNLSGPAGGPSNPERNMQLGVIIADISTAMSEVA